MAIAAISVATKIIMAIAMYSSSIETSERASEH
jgi:hypothetical protein